MTEITKESTGMNPKIKERIEQIRQGIVPEGYKKTKFGVFPVDWKVSKLADINNVNTGLTPTRKDEKYFNGDIPWVKTTDLNNSFIHTTEEKITKTAIEETSIKLVEKNSVLIAMYGGFNQIGRTGLLKVDATTNQAISSIKINEDEFHSIYVLYWLNSFRNKWRKYAASSRKDPNITKKDVEDFTIIKPKYNEQQQIAEILSTWDRAIELKEALIKEKEEQKKGLMQYLLEESLFNQQEIKLKELVYEPEKTRVEEPWNIELLTVSLHNKGVKKSDKFPNKTQKGRPYFKRYKGELLIGRQNFHNGGLGFVLEEHDSLICSNAITSLLPKEKSDMYYVYYYLSNPNYYRRIESIIGGTGQKEISKKELMNLRIKAPSLKEQNKISSILSTKDKQINLLKKELSLLKKQKKGLMQLLLTGIVRVGEVEKRE